jgi:GAF domain-containing protein
MDTIALPSKQAILDAITKALSGYTSIEAPSVFLSGLIESLLELTESECGFIGEIQYSAKNVPYLVNYAANNVSWDSNTRKLYLALQKKGIKFTKLNSLLGTVIKTGHAVISNNPEDDPRNGWLSRGHPSLRTFMGIPVFYNNRIQGIAGLGNRLSGYQPQLANRLKPFMATCGHLIESYRQCKKIQQAEAELKLHRERLEPVDVVVSLGNEYEFNPSESTLKRQGQMVMLTKKELALLMRLVEKRNQVVPYQELESFIWENRIVGESSLRSLVKKVRNKLPELNIKTISGIGYTLLPAF